MRRQVHKIHESHQWIKLGVGMLLTLIVSTAFAQKQPFLLMPRLVSLPATLLSGGLPPDGYQVNWIPATISRGKAWQREGRVYTPLSFRHNNAFYQEVDLRLVDSVVYAATDAFIQRSDSLWADSVWYTQGWSKTMLAQLAQHDRSRAQEMGKAMNSFESPLFRFNARVGEQWQCWLSLRQGSFTEQARVELLRIMRDASQRPLYLFAVNFSPSASHFPQVQEMLVSPQRGIIGMKWYEYVCWGSPGNCDDWLVQYGQSR